MVTDRRRALRFDYREGVLPPAARVRPGHDVIIVNLSSRGMLVEGTCRLPPGCLVETRLFFDDGPLQIDGEVVRAFVSAVDRISVRYRAGIAFVCAISVPAPPDLLLGYQVPGTMPELAPELGSSYPKDSWIELRARRTREARANCSTSRVALDLDSSTALRSSETRRW